MVEITKGNLQTFTVIGFIVLAFLFILPFITTLLFAAILAYGTSPIYRWLSKWVNKHVAAIGICVSIVALLAAVVNYGVFFILNELTSIFFFLANLPSRVDLNPAFTDVFRSLTTQSIAYISNQASTIPTFVVSFFLFFIALYYFLVSGKEIFNAILRIVPLDANKRVTLVRDIKANVDAFVFVTLTVGLLQGLIAAFGFLVFGLEYPLIAGVAAGVLSVIPLLGPYLLYAGISLFIIYSNGVGTGVGLLIYGLVAGSLLDYVARPYLMGKKAKSHPLVIFLGIFGGIKVLGLLGIIVGPIILSVAVTFIKDLHLYGLK